MTIMSLEQAKQQAKEIVTQASNQLERERAIAKELGLPAVRVQAIVKQIEYRHTYNQRPEVKAKRQQYNKERALEAKQVRAMLRAK